MSLPKKFVVLPLILFLAFGGAEFPLAVSSIWSHIDDTDRLLGIIVRLEVSVARRHSR